MSSAFEATRDVHLKLSREVHGKLRAFLFTKELSMQELFEEWAQLVVSEDRYAQKVISDLITKKAEAKLFKARNERTFSELDEEALYNILEKQSPIGKFDGDNE